MSNRKRIRNKVSIIHIPDKEREQGRREPLEAEGGKKGRKNERDENRKEGRKRNRERKERRQKEGKSC